jgi:UDP-3-O-[3-hydroxymyristoyl] glucosamine N-acyltransferase
VWSFSRVCVCPQVWIGDGCLLCAHTALGGSATLGDYCVMGGKSAVADHVSVCSRVRLAALSGVTKHITEPGDYAGFPAQPAAGWRREVAKLRGLR